MLAILASFLSNAVMAKLSSRPDPGASLGHDVALQHGLWRRLGRLSSARVGWQDVRRALARGLDAAEQALAAAGLDRAPWVAVSFATGIALWFVLANRWQWLALIAAMLGVMLAALAMLAVPLMRERWPFLLHGIATLALVLAAGTALVWAKSWLVGTPPIAHATTAALIGRVALREEEPAFGVTRLRLITREPRNQRVIAVRLTLPEAADQPGLSEGAVVRLRARLLPPSPPLLPGMRDMAREDWFDGIAAAGHVLGPIAVLHAGARDDGLARWRHALAAHVRARIAGSAGGIAATLVSGNRGGIAAEDQQAMRDAGLTHLLAISGLHVSAVVAGAWFLTMRLLALFPWLALRLRLPLVASGAGALAGLGYMLLTGAHLPTVRAFLGALLVLGALALGRSAFSMRLLAIAAILLLLAWPEAVIGPSFAMSFGAVITIIALHEAAPVRGFLSHHDEPWWRRVSRHLVMLFVAGMAIDLALMPIALFHFHRAGAYGALANLVAIPLVTFVAMPLIALGLALDALGAGVTALGSMLGLIRFPDLAAPVWWAAGQSLEALLAGTRWLVRAPGAVALLPGMPSVSYGAFLAGMLWLALARGRARLWGLVPVLAATASLALLRSPDVLITGDGRHLAILRPDGQALAVLGGGRSQAANKRLAEASGITAPVIALEASPGTLCNHDFCLVTLARGGRPWRILMARGAAMMPYAAMAHACAQADIVVTQITLYGPCHPSLFKADHAVLMRTGGLALDLVRRTAISVEDSEGEHPWWRAPHRLPSHAADDWELAE